LFLAFYEDKMEKVSKKDLELLEYAKSKGLTKKELEQLFLHRTKEP
jgi:hypothetical protein